MYCTMTSPVTFTLLSASGYRGTAGRVATTARSTWFSLYARPEAPLPRPPLPRPSTSPSLVLLAPSGFPDGFGISARGATTMSTLTVGTALRFTGGKFVGTVTGATTVGVGAAARGCDGRGGGAATRLGAAGVFVG